MSSPQEPIRLTREQFFRLTECIRGTLREWLMEERPGYKEVARRASEKLGYQVSVHSVQEANALCSVWEPKAAERAKANGNWYKRLQEAIGEMDSLKAKVQRQESDLEHLKMLVKHLYVELEARPPAGVTIPTETVKNRLGQVMPTNCNK